MSWPEDAFTILELGLGSLRPSSVSIGFVPLRPQYEIVPTYFPEVGQQIGKSQESKEDDRLTALICAREGKAQNVVFRRECHRVCPP